MLATVEELVLAKVHQRLRSAGLLSDSGDAPPTPPGPVLLFGGGRHTWWLARACEAFARRQVPIAAVIDDQVRGMVGHWPCVSPQEAVQRFGRPSLVILSTDTHQAAFAARVAEHFGPETPILDLYDGLPAGPYLRAEPVASPQPGRPITQPTALTLSRCGHRLADWLARHHPGPVLLIGQPWQRDAVAAGLAEAARASGRPVPTVTTEASQAKAAVVCSAELEPSDGGPAVSVPGLCGPVLTLRTGPRPWFDRTGEPPTNHQLSQERLRIVIRHDHNLGDVILSQGLLPERIKREVYPNAHITFVTSRSNWRRPGSDSTGWSLDVLKHNPWIDQIADADSFGQNSWMTGFDRAYRIDGSGDVTEHVADYHAMHVELPPGRTDFRLYLSDADRELARRVVDQIVAGRKGPGGGGPLLAVNMALAADRARGWGADKTLELCRRLEAELGATVVWMGWTDFGPYTRLMTPGGTKHADAPRPLSVREQAAVMAACDLHITCQGGGANMSAGVGCQTIALTGLHPARREGVAFMCNRSIADPSRRHVEMYRYNGELRVLNYMSLPPGEEPEWALLPEHGGRSAAPPSRSLLRRYMDELWAMTTPVDKLPAEERFWWRVRELSVEDVFSVTAETLAARQRGTAVPGV